MLKLGMVCASCMLQKRFYPPGIYLLKVNNRNSKTRCEICSKLTIGVKYVQS